MMSESSIQGHHPTETGRWKLYTSNMKTRRRTSTSDMCLRRRNAASLVFSTHGGCAPEADKFQKRVATLLAKKRNILYSEAISYVRCRVRFSILRTTLMAIRGYCGTGSTECQLAEEDLNLIPRSAMYEKLI